MVRSGDGGLLISCSSSFAKGERSAFTIHRWRLAKGFLSLTFVWSVFRVGRWSDPPRSSPVCQLIRLSQVIGARKMSGLLAVPVALLCRVASPLFELKRLQSAIHSTIRSPRLSCG